MRRRSTPSLPTRPIDPGDLSWTPVVSGVPQRDRWVRTDGLQVYLHALPDGVEGFTISRNGLPVTDADAVDVLGLFGLTPSAARCTFGRSPRSREYEVKGTQIAEVVGILARAHT